MYEHYAGYTDDEHEEFLNFIYKDVIIGPLEFKPGRVIRVMDYTAFKVSFYAVKKGVWKCGVCSKEHKFKFDASLCCEKESLGDI